MILNNWKVINNWIKTKYTLPNTLEINIAKKIWLISEFQKIIKYKKVLLKELWKVTEGQT